MMEQPSREAIELHMLESLARSQRALSRIIEAVAAQVEGSEQLAAHVAHHIERLNAYQGALIVKLTKPVPSRISSTRPAPPWFSAGRPGLLRMRT